MTPSPANDQPLTSAMPEDTGLVMQIDLQLNEVAAPETASVAPDSVGIHDAILRSEFLRTSQTNRRAISLNSDRENEVCTTKLSRSIADVPIASG
jgi:hypothetical protein